MNGDSMDAAAGRNTGHGNARKGDYLLCRASAHLQMIPAIHDFIGEAMDLHFAKKIRAQGAQDAKRNQMSHWFSPKAPVQNPGNCDERHQRSGTEPYSAPEQGALLEGDDLHRRPVPSTPPQGAAHSLRQKRTEDDHLRVQGIDQQGELPSHSSHGLLRHHQGVFEASCGEGVTSSNLRLFEPAWEDRRAWQRLAVALAISRSLRVTAAARHPRRTARSVAPAGVG